MRDRIRFYNKEKKKKIEEERAEMGEMGEIVKSDGVLCAADKHGNECEKNLGKAMVGWCRKMRPRTIGNVGIFFLG